MIAKNIISALLIGAASTAFASDPVSFPAISMVEGMINVDIDFNLADLNVKSCEAVVISPYIVNGNDTLPLEQIGVYGRRRYIQYERGNYSHFQNPPIIMRASKENTSYHYNRQLEYQDWFDGSTLSVEIRRYGCGLRPDGEDVVLSSIGMWHTPRLNTKDCFAYVMPKVKSGEKFRTIEGSANVEFPVNQTVLLEDFRGNYAEIAKIRASVDSVKNDKDVTINSMIIKGFASPEGSYANNERLAKGRTESVVSYVERLYSFPKGFITTAYDPEDWAGLRAWVEKSNLEHRDRILEIINDTALAPDPRDQKIKAKYPAEYATLLNNVYPSLRHTDYQIAYTIRTYTDPKEILEVMKTRPGNLSLDEFMVAAQTLEPGSPEYNELFEVAVRMYPEDEIANLNAANTAMMRGDLTKAEEYLGKSGNAKEAVYARGVLAMMQKDYDKAEGLLKAAQTAGETKAAGMLSQLEALREFAKASEKR